MNVEVCSKVYKWIYSVDNEKNQISLGIAKIKATTKDLKMKLC